MVKEVSEDELDGLISSTKIVIVDFSAVWCGPCKSLGKILESKVAPKFENDKDVELVKIDIDKNPGIAQGLGIQGVPTMMFFINGQKVVFGQKPEDDRIVGFRPDIDKVIDELVVELKKVE